jgi:hypothetical protein
MKFDLRSILQILPIVFLLSAGCSDSDSQTDPGGAGPDSSEIDLSSGSEDAKPEEGIPFEVRRDAENVYGGWVFFVKSDWNEVPLGDLMFLPLQGSNPPRYQAFFRPTEQAQSLKATNWTIHPESVEVTFNNGPRPQLFQGHLRDGMVYGNLINADGVCVPARLVRPASDVEKIEPEPHFADGINDFSAVMKEGAKWDDLVKFIEDHPKSPLLPNVFYTLFLQARPREIPAEKIEELFGLLDRAMSLWGERLKNFVRLNSLLQLSNDYRHPDLMESVYASLEGRFEEPVWKEPVDFLMVSLKKDIELARKVESIRQADDQQRSEILDQLQQDAESNRFNVKLLVSTAEALAEADDRQAAIEWYLKLVVVPGLEKRYLVLFERFSGELPPPSSRLNELWKEVHGSEEGLQESLAREYEKLLSGYQLPEFEFPEPNGKQVLIELFTGTACPPCVAADLAFTVLHERLPPDRVVMLQYHMHIPSTDPLTCLESEGRFGYYSPNGTPTLIVNGRSFDTLAGEASFVPNVLQQLINEIVEELSLDPRMQIDLKVNPNNDGTAAFEAAVVADEISDRWRLLVALAEGEVKYQGPNGVPVHEMVVRKLYTSSQGLAPMGGKLKLDGTIDPAKIRNDLKQEMAALRERQFKAGKEAILSRQDSENLEEQIAEFRKRIDKEYKDGPLDLDDLFLVAFVQDVRSRRVRQVVSVPVPSPSSVSSVSE